MSNHIAMVRQTCAILEEVTTIAMFAHTVHTGSDGTNDSKGHPCVDPSGYDRQRTVPFEVKQVRDPFERCRGLRSKLAASRACDRREVHALIQKHLKVLLLLPLLTRAKNGIGSAIEVGGSLRVRESHVEDGLDPGCP